MFVITTENVIQQGLRKKKPSCLFVENLKMISLITDKPMYKQLLLYMYINCHSPYLLGNEKKYKKNPLESIPLFK